MMRVIKKRMETNLIILVFIALFGIVFSFILKNFGAKYLQIQENRAKYEYSIQKRKIRLKNQRDEEDDEDEDKEHLPDWLDGILQGADVDTGKVLKGDRGELTKVKGLLDKFLTKTHEDNDKYNEDVIR